MKNKLIRLTESDLIGIIHGAISSILNESKSIKSSKLQDIFSKHGGLYKSPHSGNRHFRNYVSTDIHNMNDDDIIGVLSNDELNKVEGLYQNGLNGFAKDNGFELQPGDIVDYLKLNDGNFLVYIERNARFDWTKKEGGFKDLYDKQEKRRKLYWSDGKKMFNPMSNKAKAARELRNNPERRKQAMDYARQGKDAWGFDAIDHYKN